MNFLWYMDPEVLCTMDFESANLDLNGASYGQITGGCLEPASEGQVKRFRVFDIVTIRI